MPPLPRLLAPAALLGVLLLAPPARGAEALKDRTYHFGTHEARTNITFISEADLETIHGVTHRVAGSVRVDAAGTTATGRLVVRVADLRTGIDLRDEHLRSDQWLDAQRFPTITLDLTSATEDEGGATWTWTGNLTIKGQTRAVGGKARIRAIPVEAGKALGAGEWVRVRTDFSVRLADFGIQVPEQIGAKVSPVWQVGIDLYGTTADPAAQKPGR